MLGIKLKHAKRYQEITNAFLKNGFGYLIHSIGIINKPFSKKDNLEGELLNKKNAGMKLREVLQSLGPTFIKLGQIASTRRDLIPSEIAEELEKLQDQVSSFSYEKVREIIETELGEPVEKVFINFSEVPIATASIGQVHTASLYDGTQVAIKVQRPDIHTLVETDLEILSDLARLMESRLPWAKKFQIRKIMEEFSKTLRGELDYQTEGRNGERIEKEFTEQPEIVIPKIHWDYSTKKVLTMDYIKGIKVNNLPKLDAEGYDRKLLAIRITNSMLHQILMEGFFHADPHPGNIFVLPENKIGYVDFGMVGRLSEETKYNFASLVIHLQDGNTKGLIKTIQAMGLHANDTDMVSLYNDVDQFVMKYSTIPLSKISIGESLKDLLNIIYSHAIQVPADLSILGKTLFIVESIVQSLDPDLSIIDTVKPFGEKLLRQRYEPKNFVKNTWNEILENAQVFSKVPKSLKDLTATIQQGKLHIEMSVTELKEFMQRMDKISNRLAFSIILLSFSIMMVGLTVGASIAGQENLLWKFPAIEIGSVVATLMFIFILISIFRSGKM